MIKPNTEYRIRKTIDVQIKSDDDGDFRRHQILGGYLDHYTNEEELDAAGFWVAEVPKPEHETDPVGTVRQFEWSHNKVIKTSNGWFYFELNDQYRARETRGPKGEFQPTTDAWTQSTTKVAL